jgi:hypothetical protein
MPTGERGRRQRQTRRNQQAHSHRTKTTLAEIHDALLLTHIGDRMIATAMVRVGG